jgi:hypothetical protein
MEGLPYGNDSRFDDRGDSALHHRRRDEALQKVEGKEMSRREMRDSAGAVRRACSSSQRTAGHLFFEFLMLEFQYVMGNAAADFLCGYFSGIYCHICIFDIISRSEQGAVVL